MNYSWLRPAHLIALVLTIFCYLFLSFSLGRWLNPAPSDIRLSFEQTSPAENSLLPQRALDNHMPQLGKFPFWVDGKLMQTFGRYSPYVVRYSLFLISVCLMFFLFLRYIKPANENTVEWSLIFLLTLSGSFLLTIKFFFWLDYLVTIPLTLITILLMRKNIPGVVVFGLVMMILYVKISALFILFTFFGIFADTELLKKYRLPLVAATLISVAFFFLKWGFAPLGDRGHSFINNFSGYFMMGLNLITNPWSVVSFFDKSIQKLVTDPGPMLILKMTLLFVTAGWLLWRKTTGTAFRLICIFLSFTSALVLLRDTPTLHDFAAYNGVVELGLLSLVWIAYREASARMKLSASGVMIVISGIQFALWNAGLKEVNAAVSKVSLTEKITDLTENENKHLFLFCSWNVGEFEYFLKNVKIHYNLWDDPYFKEELRSSKPAIYLIPEKCQHEVVSGLMKQKYSDILSETGARHLERVQVDKNQIYDIYEAR